MSTSSTHYSLATKTSFVVLGSSTNSWYSLLHDRELTDEEKAVVLSNYFNDLYHMFLGKLVQITEKPSLTAEEETRLKALLEELIKVKALFTEKK